jgi:peptide/nickel transport system substrate-binding protein
MKCTILHEGKGRMRVHVEKVRMTLHRADVLEAYLNHKDAIVHAAVYERTGDVVITYTGRRSAAIAVLAGYKFDVAGAKKLLAEAGYASGFKTTIRVLSDPPFINIATNLQATLAQAGIEASVISGTGNQIYGAMRDRNFEIIVGRGGGGAEPHPHSSLRSLVYNPDNRDEAKLTNFQGWRTSFFSPEINKAIDAAEVERDEKKQNALYQEAQKLYDSQVGAIMPVSQMVDTVVLRKDIRNYHGHPSATTRFRDVFKQR